MRGGPWAPPPRLSFVSKISDSAVVFWLLFFLGCGFGLRFRSEAKSLCLLSFALQDPTPVNIIFVFSSCCFFCTPSSCFSFFLFRCWETQTRSWFVFPLMSLRCTHHPRPVLLCRQLHLGQRPRLFFFFIVVLPLVVGFGLSWLWWALALSLSLSPCGPACAACTLVLRRERGGGLPDGAPIMTIRGRSMGQCLGRPELPMLPPLPPAAL